MSHIGRPPCAEAVILHGAAAPACGAKQRRWTLAAAVIGSSLAFVDGTVVNVALPAMQRDFDASAADAQWVIEAYALLLASLLLVGGALGDRYGRRRVFVAGVVVFTVASLGCALSASVGQLLAARALQGAGAALLVPGSLALISATFPPPERGRAIGIWSAWSGIAAALGPLLGGVLIDQYSWRWAFAVNLPAGALLLVLCAMFVPESRGTAQRGPVDLAGGFWATLALAGIVFALIEAPQSGASDPLVVAAMTLGVVALVAFMYVERRALAPMLPLTLFRERSFAAANLLTLLLYAALGGGLYFFPLNLIQVQGYSATFAGAALLPFVAILSALSRSAGTLVDRFGPRWPLTAGPIVAAFGFAALALPSARADYWTGFFPAVCVLGLGMAVVVAPLTATVMNSVGTGLAGTASGINNAVSRAAGLLAIAVFGIVMTEAFDARLAAELQRLDLPADTAAVLRAQRDKWAGMTLPDGLPPAMSMRLEQVVGDSFVAGFRHVMWLCAALALLAALTAVTLPGRAPAADVSR